MNLQDLKFNVLEDLLMSIDLSIMFLLFIQNSNPEGKIIEIIQQFLSEIAQITSYIYYWAEHYPCECIFLTDQSVI